MARTLVMSGKFGPAFPGRDAEVNVLCQHCKADFINYLPTVTFGPAPFDFRYMINTLCDNCWELKR